MSGVYIKGMEMPRTCEDCNLESFCTRWVDARRLCGCEDHKGATIRHLNCPLVEVPEHGRLIDADYLKKQGFVLSRICNGKNRSWQETMSLDNAPIVIPADKEK